MAVGVALDEAHCAPAAEGRRPSVGATPEYPASRRQSVLVARPMLRAGVLVAAKEKLKWKRGGIPMPASQRGSAFKVQPGALGVVTGTNPLRVNWGDRRIGNVRGDQIRCVGVEDSLIAKLNSMPAGACRSIAATSSTRSTVSGELSTHTADSGARSWETASVSSGLSRVAGVPGLAVRRAVANQQYWGRQVLPTATRPVLCTGGLRKLLLNMLLRCTRARCS
mmetsp:Transcript_92885/g.289581  ORF Transcript_92885/g.289581 Transcript_92885/m.289581 type:complete len:223 (+) Transcript_92885:87-755(+)